jgi:uncharacterized membrane protein
MSEETPERIEPVFRNGSVTVVGVIVGFSLTFVTSWASNPSPWQLHDLLGLIPLGIGVIFQLFALSAMLHVESLERPRYDRAVRLFLIGLILVGLGLAGVITADAITVAQRS